MIEEKNLYRIERRSDKDHKDRKHRSLGLAQPFCKFFKQLNWNSERIWRGTIVLILIVIKPLFINSHCNSTN